MSIFDEKIYRMTDTELKDHLNIRLKNLGYGKGTRKITKDYLFAQGTYPILLVAHLDTVHQTPPKIICYSPDKNYITSPQGIGGDDRNGVCIILEILKTYHCSVLFTMGEEYGGVGARAFANSDIPQTLDVSYIVEFDRQGIDDCVFYDLDNPEFKQFVEDFGFATKSGSYSDICEIAPVIGAAALNLSSGYFNAHQKNEYISTQAMQNICDKALIMLENTTKFVWHEKKYTSFFKKYDCVWQSTPDYADKEVIEKLATSLFDFYVYDKSGYYLPEIDDLYISEDGEIYFINNYGLGEKLPNEYIIINPDGYYSQPEFDEDYCEWIYVVE